MSLFVKFNLILALVFALALVPAGLLANGLLQRNAREQVVENARIMMQTALATRTYTNKQIKPLLASRLEEEFLPQTVPAYSATEIFNYIRESHPEYTYKEAALNPTNPRDRTVDWEADWSTRSAATRTSRRSSASATARSADRSTSAARSASPIRAASPATRRRRARRPRW